MDSLIKELSNAFSNGEMIVGVSVGADSVLSPDKKIRIKSGDVTVTQMAETAVHFVPKTEDAIAKEIYRAGAVAVISYGLVEKGSKDMTIETSSVPKVDISDINTDKIKRALTMIVATKLNFFTTNHHTGVGTMGNYPTKVFNILYNNGEVSDITEEQIKAVHTIGHWASTCVILDAVGITGIRKMSTYPGSAKFDLADDVKIRKTGMPSGTASLALCYAIVKRLKDNNLKYAIPDSTIITEIITEYKKVIANKAGYHMSAKHLTGHNRLPFSDSKYTGYLGILGAFIDIMHPGSTICRSPKITSGKKKVYREYENFSPEFEAVCKEVKKQINAGIESDISHFLPSSVGVTEESMKSIDEAFIGI